MNKVLYWILFVIMLINLVAYWITWVFEVSIRFICNGLRLFNNYLDEILFEQKTTQKAEMYIHNKHGKNGIA